MSSAFRNRFHSDGVASISQERLLLALYDRLLADLDQAESSLARRDLPGAHHKLVHAQQIIEELHLALDPKAWEGAEQLASVYLYAHDRLVSANLRKDPALVREVRAIIAPLAETWRDAYQQLVTMRSGAAASPAPTPGSGRHPAGVGRRIEFGA